MQFENLLEEAANRRTDGTFLLCGEERVTYGEALARSNGLAWQLADLGVRHGSRVAVVLPNTPEMVYTWFALARLGAVMVPLNPALVPAEVAPLLSSAGVEGILGEAGPVATYGEMLALPIRVVAGEGEGAEAAGAVRFAADPRPAPPAPSRPTSPSDPLTILQSSGTTGRPKAALLTHASYVLPAVEFGRWMDVTPDDCFLGCLPLFHMAGQSFAASAVAGNASLALVSRFSTRHFWEQVRDHRATLVRHLGEMLALLCRQPAHPEDRHHLLRAVYGGGARPDVAAEFERRFGAPVIEGYGLTETNTVLRNELRARKTGSIGRPLPYTEMRIADENGNTLPPRQVGEIQVRRSAVTTPGYINQAELAEGCFSGDWFRTGDLGYRDEDDFYFFAGRQKDIIRRRGENIYPGGIETVLDRHPAVLASAVVGVPDDLGGEEIKAFLIYRPDTWVQAEELADWCHGWLADFEIPRYFEICPELPRTATNKINKGVLRKELTLGGICYDRKAAAGMPAAERRSAPESGARQPVGWSECTEPSKAR